MGSKNESKRRKLCSSLGQTNFSLFPDSKITIKKKNSWKGSDNVLFFSEPWTKEAKFLAVEKKN